MNHSETMNKSASRTGNSCQSMVNMALELADVRSFTSSCLLYFGSCLELTGATEVFPVEDEIAKFTFCDYLLVL